MDTSGLRAALVARRDQTVRRLRGLDESFADIVDAARDSNLDDEHDTEGTTIAATRAQVQSLARDGRRQLAEIDQALARLDAGWDTTCQSCGRVIEPERLEALPATGRCVACAHSAAGRGTR